MIITCPACATQFRVDGTKISPSGTKVRCARCSHVWLQTPDKALPYPAQPAAPKPPPPTAPPLRPEPPAAAPPSPEPVRAEPVRAEPVRSEPVPPPVRPAAIKPVFESRPAPESVRPQGSRLPPRPAAPPERSGLARLLLFGALGAALLLAGGVVYGVLHYRTAIARQVPFLADVYDLIGLPAEVIGLNVQDVTYNRTYEDGVPGIEVRGEIINVSGDTLEVPRIRAALRDKDGKELYVWTFAPPSKQLAPKQSSSFVSRLPSPPTEATTLAVSFAKRGEH